MTAPKHLPALFASPHIPASVLIVLMIFGGCTSPDPYYIDTKPFEAAAAAPVPAIDDRTIWITPIQLRRGYDGTDWIDLLIAGRQASRAAARWAETPASSSVINAVVSLRRVTPDPTPIRLATHGSLHAVSHGSARRSGWLEVDPSQPLERIVLSVPLRALDRLSAGRYEMRLVVPSMNDAGVWDVPHLDIILDEKPIQFDLLN